MGREKRNKESKEKRRGEKTIFSREIRLTKISFFLEPQEISNPGGGIDEEEPKNKKENYNIFLWGELKLCYLVLL